MIMKQIEYLKRRGHWVRAIFRSHAGSAVIPPWSNVKVDEEVLLRPTDSMLVATEGVDVFLIGYFTQLLELKGVVDPVGPILYWDQGHEHVFGDPTGSLEWDRVFHWSMQLPIALASVSDIIKDILSVHFERRAPVIPNAIDCTKFFPNPSPTPHGHAKTVLLVGNPALKLKNFQTALQALNAVHKHFPTLEVTWICQVQPALNGVTFPVNFVVNPAQEHLPELYREGHDLLLFTSVYEAWGMPVLEVSVVDWLLCEAADSNTSCTGDGVRRASCHIKMPRR